MMDNNYILELDEEHQIAKVTAFGLLNNTIIMEILGEVVKIFHSRNYHKSIIDVTESQFHPDEPLEGSVFLTMHLSSLKFNPNEKLAFIYIDSECHRKTFEKMAQKFRFQLKYFKKTDEAYSWLND